MKEFKINEEAVQIINTMAQYISGKPFNEVADLMGRISQIQIIPIEEDNIPDIHE